MCVHFQALCVHFQSPRRNFGAGSLRNAPWQMMNFFYKSSALWSFFFSKSCLKVGGVAYTRVRLIHESLRYVHVLLSAGCAIYKIIYLTRLKLGTICDNCIHTK